MSYLWQTVLRCKGKGLSGNELPSHPTHPLHALTPLHPYIPVMVVIMVMVVMIDRRSLLFLREEEPKPMGVTEMDIGECRALWTLVIRVPQD